MEIDLISKTLHDGDSQFLSAIIGTGFPSLYFKIVSSVIGILLNSLVAGIIICHKELNSKPRNIFLLSTIFSGLLAFIPSLMEIALFYNPTDEYICWSYIAIRGLPAVFVLLNTFLPLLDRYVAIQFPQWHFSKVTVPFVFFWLAVCFGITAVVNKYLYIFKLVQMECRVHYLADEITGLSLILLFLLSIIARVIVFIQTDNLLQKSEGSAQPTSVITPDAVAAPSAPTTSITAAVVGIDTATLAPFNSLNAAVIGTNVAIPPAPSNVLAAAFISSDIAVPPAPSAPTTASAAAVASTLYPITAGAFVSTRASVLPSDLTFTIAPSQVIIDLYDLDEDAISTIRNRKLNVEVRGTRLSRKSLLKLRNGNTLAMVAGLLSLFIFTFPSVILSLILIICRKVNAHTLLGTLSPLATNFEQWDLILCIYNPIVHLIWNKELLAVLKKRRRTANSRMREVRPTERSLNEQHQQQYRNSAVKSAPKRISEEGNKASRTKWTTLNY